MTCKKHPRYKAIRVPAVPCPACWRMWSAKREEEEMKAKKKTETEIATAVFPKFLTVTPLLDGDETKGFIADLDINLATKTAEDQGEDYVATYQIVRVLKVQRITEVLENVEIT